MELYSVGRNKKINATIAKNLALVVFCKHSMFT